MFGFYPGQVSPFVTIVFQCVSGFFLDLKCQCETPQTGSMLQPSSHS